MAAPERHRLRHKGVPIGPLSKAEILEQLREGRLTLAHAVEAKGRWTTLRQFLAEGAAAPARDTGRPRPTPPRAEDIPPPPPGAGGEPPSLEAVIRQGYVWCGLTFGLPFLLAFAPWIFRNSLGLGGTAGGFGLLALALGSVAYAHHRARGIATEVESEGLGDVAASLRNLAAGLGVASAGLWLLLTLAG